MEDVGRTETTGNANKQDTNVKTLTGILENLWRIYRVSFLLETERFTKRVMKEKWTLFL